MLEYRRDYGPCEACFVSGRDGFPLMPAGSNGIEQFLTSNLKLLEAADWIGHARLIVMAWARAN
jgi:hypothetical protein